MKQELQERYKKLMKEADYLDTLPLWKYWWKGGNSRYAVILDELNFIMLLWVSKGYHK